MLFPNSSAAQNRRRLEAGNFGFKKKHVLYYLCSESKCADQLCNCCYWWFSHGAAHLNHTIIFRKYCQKQKDSTIDIG